jgi:exodeoxyribonuclease-3
MKITTWNINSVRLRLPSLARVIKEISPDIICLQETKVRNELFPGKDITALGYPYQAISGMKGYNGVAILSKWPLIKIKTKEWCKRADCRHIYATINGKGVGPIEIHNFYVPAGGDRPDPIKNIKFAHKLQFLKEVAKWQKSRKKKSAAQILVGDLNIAPLPTDVWSHKQLLKEVSHTPVEKEALEKLQLAGSWTDAVREIIPPDEPLFTWWSYRSKDYKKNNRGRRLDHVWTTRPLNKHVSAIDVFHAARSWERPSDHVPITITLDV